jgi:hypothetical protein
VTKSLHQYPPKDPTALQFTLKAADATEFARILEKINRFEDYTQLIIRNSKIRQPLTNTGIYAETDLTNLIGAGINISFMLSNKKLKKVSKLLKSGETSIIHDKEDSVYWFRTGHQNEILDEIEGVDDAQLTVPVFTSAQYIGNPVVIADILDIQKYIEKSSFVWLLVYASQFEQILCHDRNSPYTLKATGAGSLEGKKPDMVFICHFFLTIAEKQTKLRLAQNADGIWLVTETKLNSKSGNITIYQKLIDNS